MASSSLPGHAVSSPGAVASPPPSHSVSSPAPPPSGSPQDSGAVKSSSAVKTSSPTKTSSSSPTNDAIKSSSTTQTSASPTSHATSPVAVPSPPAPGPSSIRFTGTTTSTITDPPESTLAKPTFVSVVESGKTSFIAPPLVTILSTSMEPNGSFVTFTHVVANPTGFSEAIAGGRASFFHNAGAVAGVFLVIGMVLTALVAWGTFIMCRRKRRRQEAHRRWLISINRPRPMAEVDGDPFEDHPRSAPSPPMRIAPGVWDAPSAWATQAPHTARRESSTSGLGLFDVPATQHNEVVNTSRNIMTQRTATRLDSPSQPTNPNPRWHNRAPPFILPLCLQ
ncbi:hypothetical protein K438DRAFT_1073667 [Mycena galopus ATCC 62051]|nr:hypothetical protein K438DRAFT_1073667 [Mycena galopus ATCC 62051]